MKTKNPLLQTQTKKSMNPKTLKPKTKVHENTKIPKPQIQTLHTRNRKTKKTQTQTPRTQNPIRINQKKQTPSAPKPKTLA